MRTLTSLGPDRGTTYHTALNGAPRRLRGTLLAAVLLCASSQAVHATLIDFEDAVADSAFQAAYLATGGSYTEDGFSIRAIAPSLQWPSTTS